MSFYVDFLIFKFNKMNTILHQLILGIGVGSRGGGCSSSAVNENLGRAGTIMSTFKS